MLRCCCGRYTIFVVVVVVFLGVVVVFLGVVVVEVDITCSIS
jgi:hypothetical protein